jgi:hypothetical protein
MWEENPSPSTADAISHALAIGAVDWSYGQERHMTLYGCEETTDPPPDDLADIVEPGGCWFRLTGETVTVGLSLSISIGEIKHD